uniref:Uncharacterized protein n=1 Tax=Ascaris lumbricoides TaxID=6252 RepID=A0A0M3HHI2_ASCLU
MFPHHNFSGIHIYDNRNTLPHNFSMRVNRSQ